MARGQGKPAQDAPLRRNGDCRGALASCATDGAPDEVTKEEASQRGGKSDDGVDYCKLYEWYGDEVCDSFCTQPDPDCVEVDDPTFCREAVCSPGSRCDEETDRCVPDEPNWCETAACFREEICNEATDSCVSDDR